ncbi:hypothetical protein FXO37_28690 [Capsicum annuum]|nr:hypothetical protein FXO37_28690 [Capsicum annuum]
MSPESFSESYPAGIGTPICNQFRKGLLMLAGASSASSCKFEVITDEPHAGKTYVLDVHPFNPRIAMSAGYDGKTILWDIWEGIPIRTYDIGRFKLVDGKFSQDGTSIVLSDDVGQIYLLNTGQGESQKDAKYDQFFLGDYRPLIQDVQGNVLDQVTGSSLGNSLWQKCKVRLCTIHPCGGALPRTLRTAVALVHQDAL